MLRRCFRCSAHVDSQFLLLRSTQVILSGKRPFQSLRHGFWQSSGVCIVFRCELAQQPLLHGLLVGIVGTFIIGHVLFRAPFTKPALIAIVALSGLFEVGCGVIAILSEIR
jgi:hypothetical protein